MLITVQKRIGSNCYPRKEGFGLPSLLLMAAIPAGFFTLSCVNTHSVRFTTGFLCSCVHVQKFVAYTGNHMQKKEPPVEIEPTVCWDTVNSYLSYSSTSRRQGQTSTSSSIARGKTSGGRRPTKTGSKAGKKWAFLLFCLWIFYMFVFHDEWLAYNRGWNWGH